MQRFVQSQPEIASEWSRGPAGRGSWVGCPGCLTCRLWHEPDEEKLLLCLAPGRRTHSGVSTSFLKAARRADEGRSQEIPAALLLPLSKSQTTEKVLTGPLPFGESQGAGIPSRKELQSGHTSHCFSGPLDLNSHRPLVRLPARSRADFIAGF